MSTEGHPVERDRTTDVARQYDTDRSQSDGKNKKDKEKSRGLNHAHGKTHTGSCCMSRDSVRRALGRVTRRARGRHGLRGVRFGDLREFKGGFYQERFPINSFTLTRVRLV